MGICSAATIDFVLLQSRCSACSPSLRSTCRCLTPIPAVFCTACCPPGTGCVPPPRAPSRFGILRARVWWMTCVQSSARHTERRPSCHTVCHWHGALMAALCLLVTLMASSVCSLSATACKRSSCCVLTLHSSSSGDQQLLRSSCLVLVNVVQLSSVLSTCF